MQTYGAWTDGIRAVVLSVALLLGIVQSLEEIFAGPIQSLALVCWLHDTHHGGAPARYSSISLLDGT